MINDQFIIWPQIEKWNKIIDKGCLRLRQPFLYYPENSSSIFLVGTKKSVPVTAVLKSKILS